MTIGFIGAGNMGGALAAAVAKASADYDLLIADIFINKAAVLAAEIGGVSVVNESVANRSDFIFLGVKPQMMQEMLAELRPVLDARETKPVLISMAAGLSVSCIEEWSGGLPVIRIMPNTPVTVGDGMILYTASQQVTEEQKEEFIAMLSAAGRLSEMPERLIDAGSAVSGCSPAFAYLFIEALADGGVECGLPRHEALDYAAQTVLGAAKMVLTTGRHPGDLKDAVCSPGGTTIAGVHAMEAGGFRSVAMDAVTAAYKRTMELKQ